MTKSTAMTTPDYAGLLERLEESPNHAFILAAYERRELIIAIRTLLESNAALERERTNLIETKREQIDRLNTRVAELVDLCNSLEAQAMGLAYDLERAEAKLAEAMKVIEPFAREAEQISDKSGVPENQISDDVWVSVRLRDCRTARKFLKENGNGE